MLSGSPRSIGWSCYWEGEESVATVGAFACVGICRCM